MTYEEAVSALAVDAAAVVWVGKNYETLISSFSSTVDPQASPIIADVRKALATAPDAPTRLMILKNGTASLAAVLTAREKAKAAGAATLEAHRREVARRHREHDAAEQRRARAHRATFPVFQSLRARLTAVEAQFGDAATAAEVAAAEAALADACSTASASIAVAAAALIPAA